MLETQWKPRQLWFQAHSPMGRTNLSAGLDDWALPGLWGSPERVLDLFTGPALCMVTGATAVPKTARLLRVSTSQRTVGPLTCFSNAGFNRSGGGGYNQNRWGNNNRDNNSNNRGSYNRAPQQQPPPQQPPPPQPPPQQPPPPPTYSPARNPPGASGYNKNSNIPGSSASTSTPPVSSYSPPQVRG